GRGRRDIAERPVEPYGGVLQDVVGLLPPFQTRVVFEHFPGQLQQARAGAVEQLLAGGFVSRLQSLDPTLDLSGLRARVGHAPALSCATDTGLPASRSEPDPFRKNMPGLRTGEGFSRSHGRLRPGARSARPQAAEATAFGIIPRSHCRPERERSDAPEDRTA